MPPWLLITSPQIIRKINAQEHAQNVRSAANERSKPRDVSLTWLTFSPWQPHMDGSR